MSLEAQFHKAMQEIVRRSIKDCGYNPRAFIDMMNEGGGVQAAKRLLAKPSPSDGFTTLWTHKRLDLTVEASVLRAEFAPLFTLAERQKAWDWLLQYEWDQLGDRPAEVPPVATVSAAVAPPPVAPETAKVDAAALLGRLAHYSFPIPAVNPLDEFDEGRRQRVIPEGDPIRRLPGVGVYVFLKGTEVLYVGSARANNLVGRALDYLCKEGGREKTYTRIRQEADRLVLIFTPHGVTARMLEADLIARLQPVLNDDLNWGEGEEAVMEYHRLADQLRPSH